MSSPGISKSIFRQTNPPGHMYNPRVSLNECLHRVSLKVFIGKTNSLGHMYNPDTRGPGKLWKRNQTQSLGEHI